MSVTRHLFVLASVVLLNACATTLSPARSPVYLLVLGVAQDAGHPQAGCFEPHCIDAWRHPAKQRLASSLALIDKTSATHYLLDVTPDLAEQLFRLHEEFRGRKSRLAGLFLTHAHIGHYAGLMYFGQEVMGSRELPVYGMPRMQSFLVSNGPWEQLLSLKNLVPQALHDGTAVVLNEQLRVTPFLVPHRDEYSETVGFRIDGPHRSAVYLPDIDKWERWSVDIRDVIRSVDYAFLDATFFADGELPGRDMSKIPHPFVSESMALFAELSPEERSRVIFIHMNHSNPLLNPDSEAHQRVTSAGFRVATPGMRVDL